MEGSPGKECQIGGLIVRCKRPTLLPSFLSFSLVSSPVSSTSYRVGMSVSPSSLFRPSHRRGDEMRIFSTLNLAQEERERDNKKEFRSLPFRKSDPNLADN